MNPQESRLLQDFLDQLVQVRGITKDPQAESLINQAFRQQPDAAYLLVQRALLQEQALEAAKAQIAALQNQAQQSSRQGGFLDTASDWGNSARSAGSAPVRATANAATVPPPDQAYAGYAAPRQSSMFGTSSGPGMLGGGSFLGNMAATAAGVVGGAFLYQGLENLLGHHGSGHNLADSGQQGFGALDNTQDTDRYADTDFDNSDSDMASDAGIDDISLDDDSSAL